MYSMHAFETNWNRLILGDGMELAREWQDISDKCNCDDPCI